MIDISTTEAKNVIGAVKAALGKLKSKNPGTTYDKLKNAGLTIDNAEDYVKGLSDEQFTLLQTATGNATAILGMISSDPFKNAAGAATKDDAEILADANALLASEGYSATADMVDKDMLRGIVESGIDQKDKALQIAQDVLTIKFTTLFGGDTVDIDGTTVASSIIVLFDADAVKNFLSATTADDLKAKFKAQIVADKRAQAKAAVNALVGKADNIKTYVKSTMSVNEEALALISNAEVETIVSTLQSDLDDASKIPDDQLDSYISDAIHEVAVLVSNEILGKALHTTLITSAKKDVDDVKIENLKTDARFAGVKDEDLTAWLGAVKTDIKNKIDAGNFDSELGTRDFAKTVIDAVATKKDEKDAADSAARDAKFLKKIEVLKAFIDKEFSPFDKKKVKQLFGKGFKDFKLIEEVLRRVASGGKTAAEVILEHSKRPASDSSYLSPDGLNGLYAAVVEYVNREIIDKTIVDEDKLVTGLSGSATPEEQASRRGLISEDINAADSHIDETISPDDLAKLIGLSDEDRQQRIADNSARRRIKKAYNTLGGDDATPHFEVSGAAKTVDEMSSEELATTLATYTEYVARKEELVKRAQADDIKDKGISVPKFDQSTLGTDLDTLESSVLRAELEVLGETGTVTIPKAGGAPGETETIDIATETDVKKLRTAKETKLASNQLNADQNALRTKVNGTEIVYFVGVDGKVAHKKFSELTDDEVALINGKLTPKNKKDKKEPKYNKNSVGQLEKDAKFKNDIVEALKVAGADETAAKEFVKTAKFAECVGAVVAISEDAFKQAIIDGAIAKYTAERRKVLEGMLNIPDGFKFKGTDELKNLLLSDIEKYIAKATEFKTKLNEGAADDDKQIEKLNAGDLDQFISGSATVSKDLGILLAYGFNLTQANRLLAKHKGDIGMTGSYDRKSVSTKIVGNTAKFTILGNNTDDAKTKWPDHFKAEIKAYYTDEKNADRDQLADDYAKIVKDDTLTAIDGAVDKLVGKDASRHKSGDKLTVKLADLKDELDALELKTLQKLHDECKSDTIDDKQKKAKYKMLLALKRYQELVDGAKKDLSPEAEVKQNIEIDKALIVVENATQEYLLIVELQELADKIQAAVKTDGELGKHKGKGDKIKDTDLPGLQAAFKNLRTEIDALEAKIDELKDLFGIVIDSEAYNTVKKDAKELVKDLAPTLETTEDQLARITAEAAKNDDTSLRFSKEQYDGLLTAKAAHSVEKATMEGSVKDLIGDEEDKNYMAVYNNKYGKDDGKGGKTDAYNETLTAMRDLDRLHALGSLSDAWFRKYAMSLAVAITSVINSVETKTELDVEDKANYAHIMIMVQAESETLDRALEAALTPDVYKSFKKLFAKAAKGKTSDILYSAEKNVELIRKLADAIVAYLTEKSLDTTVHQVVGKLNDDKKLNLLVVIDADGNVTFKDKVLKSIAEAIDKGMEVDAILLAMVKPGGLRA